MSAEWDALAEYRADIIQATQDAGEQTMRAIRTSVEGRTEWVTKAALQLVADGYVARRDGPRNSVLLASTKPYRQADDA